MIVALLSAVAGIVVAALTAWATVATVVRKIERERQAAAEVAETRRVIAAEAAETRREEAEERREEARRVSAQARETSLVDALRANAEAEARTTVALGSLADHVDHLRRTVERLPRALAQAGAISAPAEEERPSMPSPPPPPIPRRSNTQPRLRAISDVSIPIDSDRSATLPGVGVGK